MPRQSYPRKIELKVPNEVSDRGFSTDDRHEAAQIIQEKWPEINEFKIYGEKYRFSEGHFSNVWWEYFGPQQTVDPRDSELTFNDLKAKYGGLKEWRQHEKEFQLKQESIQDGLNFDDGAIDRVATMAGIELEDDHDRELFYLGIKFGVEMNSLLGQLED